MTPMIYFDTLKYVETLRDAGISDKQAKAFAKVQQEALSESLDTALATKADIMGLKSDIADVKSELMDVRSELIEVKSTLKSEIADVKSELKSEIADVHLEITEVKSDVRLLKWMISFVFTGIVALVLKAFF